MREAVAALVHDGDSVAIEGFTHLICFAAGHEIIRQGRRDLELIRMTPDVIYDQMIAAGCARKLVFGWLGNPGVGSLHAIRRVTEGPQASLELEEYSHFGMVGRYTAGAARMPFYPLRSYLGTDMPKVNPRIAPVPSPYGDETVYVVPPLNPDVTIVHAQRADAAGDTQVWGLVGSQKEAAFAARRVIVVVEELVDEAVVRADPNRTVIPGHIVDAVVVEPCGAHPSYAQGHYDRDNAFYVEWDEVSREPDRLDEGGVAGHSDAGVFERGERAERQLVGFAEQAVERRSSFQQRREGAIALQRRRGAGVGFDDHGLDAGSARRVNERIDAHHAPAALRPALQHREFLAAEPKQMFRRELAAVARLLPVVAEEVRATELVHRDLRLPGTVGAHQRDVLAEPQRARGVQHRRTGRDGDDDVGAERLPE